ncbi:hypothetical protein [Streptomyces sp. ISL-10]|nr:hypothetical protein [Streptomyces sp. ISL-10]
MDTSRALRGRRPSCVQLARAEEFARTLRERVEQNQGAAVR